MDKPDVFMPLYIGDYLAGTSRLTTELHGAYLLLIMDYWMNGPLPDNDQILASIVKMPMDAWSIARASLEHHFSIENGEWKHKRVEQELAAAYEKKRKAKEKAAAAAAARWAKEAEKKGNSENETSSNASGNATSTAQAMHEECPSPSPSPSNKTNKTLDQSSLDHDVLDFCFNQFWDSGIRKVGRKKCLPLFAKVLKTHAKPDGPTGYDFTTMLVSDIQKRLAINQLGFSEMHPTTYLNGERWNDEVIPHDNENRSDGNSGANRLTLPERVQANINKQRAERGVPGLDRAGVAETDGNVRVQVHEPVRGATGQHVGVVLEGDYRETDC